MAAKKVTTLFSGTVTAGTPEVVELDTTLLASATLMLAVAAGNSGFSLELTVNPDNIPGLASSSVPTRFSSTGADLSDSVIFLTTTSDDCASVLYGTTAFPSYQLVLTVASGTCPVTLSVVEGV